MPSHASARVRVRRNARRADINNDRLSAIRTGIKKVESAIAAGDLAAAEKALKAVQPDLQRGAGKRVVSKKSAARKMSRLSARVKSLKK